MKRQPTKKKGVKKVAPKKKTCHLLVKNFPEALKWKLKEAAAADRITLAQYLEQMVHTHLAGKRKK